MKQPHNNTSRVANAEVELAKRELAWRDFYEYAHYVYKGYPSARHLQILAAHLQDVETYVKSGGREGCGRLMINMPPRHWKSTTTSVIFPTWFLGRNPDKRVIVTSYNGSLAFGFSRRARNTMQDTAFQNVFGKNAGRCDSVAIADDSRSIESWDLSGYLGGMAAAGVGGGITGKGANLFIIDDPHKDRAEAESKAKRETINEWYKSTAYTRLEPGAAMIVIQTRWHSDDLSGKLLKAMVEDEKADIWRVVNMPAIAESWTNEDLQPENILRALKNGWYIGRDPLGRKAGQPLWPGVFPLDALDKIKANLGGYEWESLYQQRPQRREGAMIRADLIRIVTPEQVPDLVDEVRYWDLAVSGKRRADYISGARVGESANGATYILNIARMRGPWVDARPKMIDIMLRDPAHVRQGIEVSGQQGGYYQEMAVDEKLKGRIIEGVNPREIGNKEVRAQIWASRIPDNLVFIVNDGTWDIEQFISECLSFPAGHDDQVDGVSGAKQMLGGWGGSMNDVPQDEGHNTQWAFAQQGIEPLTGAISAWDIK